jgi:hypothetical protein
MGLEKMLGINKADIEKFGAEYNEIKSKIDFIYFVAKAYYVNHKDEIDKALKELKKQEADKNGK